MLRLLVSSLPLLFVSTFAAAFGSGPAPTLFAPGKVVYAKVAIHCERKGDAMYAYSTNYIGLDTVIPVNAKLTVLSADDDEVRFARENNTPLEIEYVEKHNKVSFSDWANKNFAEKAVELPKDLSDKEKKAIEAGRYEVGMSRRAIFLAIGYPPKSLTLDDTDRVLKYAKKRFNNVSLTFDDKDKVIDVKD